MGVKPVTVNPEIPVDFPETGWEIERWSDGNEQVWNTEDGTDDVYIERVVGEKSRRKRWCIVSRVKAEDWSLYPPKVAGPFPSLTAAIVAYKVLYS